MRKANMKTNTVGCITVMGYWNIFSRSQFGWAAFKRFMLASIDIILAYCLISHSGFKIFNAVISLKSSQAKPCMVYIEYALCVALKPWAVNLYYLNKLIMEEGEARFELRKWNTTKSIITNGLSIEQVKSTDSMSPCTIFIYFKAPIALSDDFVNNLKYLEIFPWLSLYEHTNYI